MRILSKGWYNLILSIFFWIFAWGLSDALIDSLNLSNGQKIILNFTLLIIVVKLISMNKSFFYN